MAELWQRLDTFRQSDREREELITGILKEHEELQARYREKCQDFDNEVHFRRVWQNEHAEMQRKLTEQQRLSNSSPFVTVLIDGDGAVFQDYLLAAGKEGGADAAHMLFTELRDLLKNEYPDSNVSDWKIMVTTILNLQGLAAKLHACDIIGTPAELGAFARAFGLTQALFNFVDVGSGKERADHKIREMLALYVGNNQCKHIFFGPCHDNGYLPVFEPYKRDPSVSSRLTLIETTPAEPGFLDLGFKRVRFAKVFRTEALPPNSVPPSRHTNQRVSSSPQSVHVLPFSGAPVRAPSLSTIPTSAPVVPKSSSPAPSNESAHANTWATVGKGNSASKTINIASKKTAKKRYILLNAYGDRNDEELPRMDQGAQLRFNDRLRKLGKCCNHFHLNGHCPSGEFCDYSHGQRMSPGEQLVLKHKARTIPCTSLQNCRDFDCISGHHCKFGAHCLADQCRFANYHHTTVEPAKKFYEDGSEEWLQSYVDKHKSD